MNKRKDWKSNFDFSPLEIDGNTYQVTYEDLKPIESDFNYWHAEGKPSSWLAIATFKLVRSKFKELPEVGQLLIASHLLGIPQSSLIGSIKWHDGYMTWHDGREVKTLEGEYK